MNNNNGNKPTLLISEHLGAIDETNWDTVNDDKLATEVRIELNVQVIV